MKIIMKVIDDYDPNIKCLYGYYYWREMTVDVKPVRMWEQFKGVTFLIHEVPKGVNIVGSRGGKYTCTDLNTGTAILEADDFHKNPETIEGQIRHTFDNVIGENKYWEIVHIHMRHLKKGRSIDIPLLNTINLFL